MQSSKLPAQDKKSKTDASDDLQRRTIAAQIKLEEKRLQLEIQIRKKNEEEKQKALLKKQQKEALSSQRKDTKIENPSRSDVSRLSKDSEVKDSLSQEKADEIQNNLQSLIKSKTFEPFSSEDEPTQALERDIESSEKQDSGRNDNADEAPIENYAPISQNDKREARSNEYKPSREKSQQDDISKRFENLESKHERATTEKIYARDVKEEYSPKKLELKIGSPSLERSSDREGLIRNTAKNSNPDNFIVPKNNSYENQTKMETNVTSLKEDRDPLGGAVKLQLELANQMKKFKLDEEKRKKNKEEAGLQRKHEILRQIKGTGMGQPNLMKPESGQLNSLSSAEKDRSIRGSKNLDASHEEEDVRREEKFSGLKATPEVAENDRGNHLRMSQRKSVQNDKEASEEDVQYGESSESEDPVENDFEQSRGDELLNDSQQYNKITKSFSSQRNDLDPRVSQQRSSGGYKETLNREYLISNDRDEDIQEHQPQSYAQLHARKNLNPERKVVNPDTEEGLSKLLRSYEKGDPEEERDHYRTSHEDSKRQDEVELNYSQSERELEDTNQNPLLTFGKKDFNRKDEGINPLDMSNSFRKSLQDTEGIPKTQPRSVIENKKDENYRNDDSQRNNANWGYNPKTNAGIKQTSDIKYEPFEEQEEDEEDYERNHEISQNEEEEEERSNETGGFANNVEREQNLSEEDDADQKPYYIVDQPQMGSLSGSGQKKKELIRYGADQVGNDDDFSSGSFGYRGQDKPSRVRKGWGDTKTDDNSAKNPTSVNSFAPIEDEENEYDEEEYDADKRSEEEEEAEVIHKEDQKHEDDKKSENKLITFDDSEDETTRQRKMKKFENFMQRRQESQDRMKEKKEKEKEKEKEKAKRAQNQPRREEITFGNVSEESTPQNSKRPISRERHSQNTKQDQVPIHSNKMRPPSANVKNQEKPIKKGPNEEFKSVETSAKSNKSEMKSPSPNNIFVQQRPSISGKKEFSKPTNKQNIKNAITNVCLAGEPNRKEREEVLSKLDEFKGEANFIIAFNAISARLVFKAVYAYDTVTGEIKKIYSNGTIPDMIDSSVVVNYYNYNNGPKEFKPIQGNKNFSLRVDAVSLQPQLFRKPTSQNLF